ncbi:TetR/AcrR family transcriptional regulator [Glaciimonas sp. Gout2]|uniref:TetR/AcrR family transcriptional regulator n=1 Tax=unclassified Glaciimonas TaxID=2644401 RepID=UPI002B2398AD|nr:MULTISPECIES: TetR/AcrR family transcriptional regulator [unclassified Glaciimonas]MEB0013687.1 TetR/AcrR family transcriptional regulator [Glaciimonas sp. Cout2]MEB0081899.1 TetR/AcrR family transcriptional regulator [Glaciimonas sp. Gout2]
MKSNERVSRVSRISPISATEQTVKLNAGLDGKQKLTSVGAKKMAVESKKMNKKISAKTIPKVSEKNTSKKSDLKNTLAEIPPREPGRNKRSGETIDQILAAAEQVILELGVDRVAIQNVCEVAGISRGTFYRYFSSQDELLDAFSKHKRARFHLALHAATAPYLTPEDRFNALISYLDNYLKHSKARRLLEVAPEFAFGFFKRIFHDSVDRFQEVLDIVFDAWDAKLGIRIDRELVCEMLIRYVLSELLVPRKGDRRQLLSWITQLIGAISRGGDFLLQPLASCHLSKFDPDAAQTELRHERRGGSETGGDSRGDATNEPGRNRRSEKTIDQILVATEQVILESGVDRVSILTVCEVAGISRGTFYRYFSSQDELLEAYTQHKRGVFHQALISATEPYDDPDERFIALVAHLDNFLKGTKARRLLQVAPKYAFGFFQHAFLDSLDRFQDALKIVFDAWDARLGVKLDRELICEMIIRYVLSELLVLGEGDRRQLPQRIGRLISSIGERQGHIGNIPMVVKPAEKSKKSVALIVPPPREPGRNRRSVTTIQQIIAAAEEVILVSGVERVSILAVCEVAGISRGTFYRYFSSQDALLDAFSEHQRAQFHQRLVEVATLHADPDDRFNAVIGYIDHFLRQDKVRRLLAVAPEYAFAFFQRMFDDAVERYKSVLEIVFDDWDKRLATQIDRDLACELLVRYVLSELLVPTDVGKSLLPLRLGTMIRGIVVGKGL